ncbi:hypothetical protein LTR53_015621 [Teratosphaeriaceae sp. CCFEE 6253]|nr:hypothetical protein LTR53_015621 [Teratosphaeriaceae sp. CCFEE 6253]
MSAAPADLDDSTFLYHQLAAYPWDSDPEFQSGLRAILGPLAIQDTDQVAHLTLRAQCYYYARKAGTAVDFDGYRQWLAQDEDGRDVQRDGEVTYRNGGDSRHTEAGAVADGGNVHGSPPDGDQATAPAQVNGTTSSAPTHPATFAEICDMIAEGKPIPGIKDIPDTILEGHASEKKASGRMKPWEKTARAEADSVAVGGARVEGKASWMR